MSEPRKLEENEIDLNSDDAGVNETRRDFLRRLGRWSAIIIGGAAFAGMVEQPEANAAGWVNARGGGRSAAWVNRAGGGGAAWVNRSGGGGAAWVNRSGGWINGGGWVNGGGGGWINARGGWVNRH